VALLTLQDVQSKRAIRSDVAAQIKKLTKIVEAAECGPFDVFREEFLEKDGSSFEVCTPIFRMASPPAMDCQKDNDCKIQWDMFKEDSKDSKADLLYKVSCYETEPSKHKELKELTKESSKAQEIGQVLNALRERTAKVEELFKGSKEICSAFKHCDEIKVLGQGEKMCNDRAKCKEDKDCRELTLDGFTGLKLGRKCVKGKCLIHGDFFTMKKKAELLSRATEKELEIGTK